MSSPGTPSGLCGEHDGTVSVSLRGCAFRSSFTPDGHDIHIQTRVRRPPTLDTGRVPGPDTWSVVRRQVRQETDQCLLATCQSLSLAVTSHSRLFLPRRLPPFLITLICKTNHLCFRRRVTSAQIHFLRQCISGKKLQS